jgi:putative ABC transport system permease protein
MIRHIIIAGLRNIAANKLLSAIAIFGLSVGIAIAIMAGLLVRNQLTYEHFIPGHERTYTGISSLMLPDRPPIYNEVSHRDVAALLRLNTPEIAAATRLMAAKIGPNGRGGVILKRDDVTGAEQIYWAEPNLAEVLPLPVWRGNLKTALQRPDGIVLDRRTAQKYFGSEEVVGRTILLDGYPMTVRAVIEDLPAMGTELVSGIFASSLAPFSAFARDRAAPPTAFLLSVQTYLRLRPGADIAAVKAKVPALIERLSAGVPRAAGQRLPVAMELRRIDQVNLHEGLHPGARNRLTVTALIGLLILFISTVNFVNFLTARAVRRAREVGVRKACGAQRGILVAQFLGEATLTVAFSTALALALSDTLLPMLNAFLETGAVLDYWTSLPLGVTLLLGIGLLGLLAGAWPALVLSVFRPVQALKGTVLQPEGAGMVRGILTGAQFAILVVLVIAAIVVWQQRNYATREALRADIANVVMVRDACKPAFRAELRKLPGVDAVSCSSRSFLDGTMKSELIGRQGPIVVDHVRVDPGIFALYGFTPLAGSLASASLEGDESDSRGVILNREAARQLGFASPQAAVGQSLPPGLGSKAPPTRVIAVVPDFTFVSVEERLHPAAYFPGLSNTERGNLVSIRLRPGDPAPTLAAIDRLWIATGNEGPISRFFLENYMQEQYRNLMRQAQLLTGFSALGVLLACLGLVGLSIAAAERRIKEIGIRKAMGATTPQVVGLLLWQSSLPVLLANLVAWPVAFWLMQRWLAGFAYHVDLQWWVFPAASGAALLLALLTVAAQVMQTARQKPVLALRYE